MAKRYKDAYVVGRTIVAFGGIIKTFGLVLGSIAAVVSLAQVKQSGEALALAGLFLSLVAGGVIYGIGILISAQGQILTATLDTAVNGSPFLSDAQRANAMSL